MVHHAAGDSAAIWLAFLLPSPRPRADTRCTAHSQKMRLEMVIQIQNVILNGQSSCFFSNEWSKFMFLSKWAFWKETYDENSGIWSVLWWPYWLSFFRKQAVQPISFEMTFLTALSKLENLAYRSLVPRFNEKRPASLSSELSKQIVNWTLGFHC